MEILQREKPWAVTLALYLLWASLAVGLGKTAWNYSSLAATPNLTLTLVVVAVILAVYIFLILMMSAGRNWARITFLVLFLVGLVFSVPVLLADFGRSLAIGALSLADVVLQACALFLVFTRPGNTWFRKRTLG